MIITDHEMNDLVTEFGDDRRILDFEDVTYLLAQDETWRLERGERAGVAGRLQVWPVHDRDLAEAVFQYSLKHPTVAEAINEGDHAAFLRDPRSCVLPEAE